MEGGWEGEIENEGRVGGRAAVLGRWVLSTGGQSEASLAELILIEAVYRDTLVQVTAEFGATLESKLE